MVQLTLSFIKHSVGKNLIAQSTHDGYVNATAMCQSAGKQWNDYYRLASTKAFLNELSLETGYPVSAVGEANGLVKSRKGGESHLQGTWVHPDVAIHLGQWLSPKFAVMVSKWVREWMQNRSKQNVPSSHIRRYTLNRSKIPFDSHFSVLNELTLGLIAPLEEEGYILPDKLVPDISEGRMFSDWLRKIKQIDPSTFPTYPHRYLDGRVVSARLYPIELLGDFRNHLYNVWIPQRAFDYFKERDPKALEYLPKLLMPGDDLKAA